MKVSGIHLCFKISDLQIYKTNLMKINNLNVFKMQIVIKYLIQNRTVSKIAFKKVISCQFIFKYYVKLNLNYIRKNIFKI